MRQTEERVLQAAEVMASKTRWAIGSYRVLLNRLSEDARGNPVALSPLLTERFLADQSDLPGQVVLGAYSVDGLVVSSEPAPGFAPVITETEAFQRLSGGGAQWVTSSLVVSASGEEGFFIGRRLGLDGRFAGALVLLFDGGLLELFRTPLNLGPGASASLVRDDGWVVSRVPPLDRPLTGC